MNSCYAERKSYDNIIRMKLFLTILLNIFIAVSILYLLILIIDVTFVISFSSIMKHHAHDLTVILTNKRDNLAKLAECLTNSGIKLDKKKMEKLQNFDTKRLEIKDDEDSKAAREELTSINEYLLSVCEQNQIKDKDGEYQKTIDNIYELEKVYRQHLMMYNADVLGYNFWIAFVPTRFIYIILKFKNKENI